MLSLKRDLQFGFDCENVIDDVAFITYMLVRFEKVIELVMVVSMAVLQHGQLLETVGASLDLDVKFSFCAPVFAMSIINLM